jgi:hypothetical protein
MTDIRLSDENDMGTRIGIAKLTKMAFDGIDLGPLWQSLLAKIAQDPSDTSAVMDMSIIAQLLGDQPSGLALQAGALNINRLYRSPCAVSKPRLKVLALAAPTDIGGNTPIEFLLEESDVELCTLYVVPGARLDHVPEHDIAIVVAPDSYSTRDSLSAIETLLQNWPRPVLNLPQRIAALDRDRLHMVLKSVPGLDIPATARISRAQLADIGHGGAALQPTLEDGAFPLIVRPIDSHAGRGLTKLESPDDIAAYLVLHTDDHFFLSRYVDYSDADGLFRKYRIAMVDGKPFACHMAISDQWKIWYLNAGMAQNAEKRREEAHFMARFDEIFAERHRHALAHMTQRIGLDYFAIDCAETKSGELLIFEGDNAMIIHNMDPPDIYPYKPAQMHKIFDAFVAMLYKYSGRCLSCAA